MTVEAVVELTKGVPGDEYLVSAAAIVNDNQLEIGHMKVMVVTFKETARNMVRRHVG